MGKIADALARQTKDVAMAAASGRIATIVNTDLELWVKDGNKEQRDEVASLYPAVTLKWAAKAQLGKFVNNIGCFTKVPFVVVKLEGKMVRFTY